MAVTAPIPLPQVGLLGSQEMINGMMNNRYNQGKLAIDQQEQARLQQILPYIIQKYKDEQLKAQRENDIYNKFFGNGSAQGSTQPAPMNPFSSNEAARPSVNLIGNGRASVPNESDISGIRNERPGDSYVVGSGRPPSQGVPSQQDIMQGLQNQGQGSPAISPQTATDVIQQPNAAPQNNQLTQMGQEKVVKNGDPRKEMWDKFAGMTIPGTSIKIPDIKTKIQDGVQYDTYPSGKVVATKIGNTDEEKANITLNSAEQKEQAKADIKFKTQEDDYFKNLAQYADNNAAIAKIFERNPAGTGLLPFAKKKFKFGDKDYAAVNRLAVPMVGDLAQELSKKGSVFALQLAKEGKYDPSQPYDYNMGILEQNNDAIVRDYNRRAAAYKEKFGKEPPYKLPEYYKQWENKQKQEEMMGKVTIIDSNGDEHVIDRDKINAARQRDPGLKVKKENFSAAKI